MRAIALACLSILALVGAFHLGANSAVAGVGEFVGICSTNRYSSGGSQSCTLFALTASGEVWMADVDDSPIASCPDPSDPFPQWILWGMIDGTVKVEPSTWGKIKADYR